MANNEQKTSTIDTVVPGRPGLVTDLNTSYVGKEKYSHARNAVRSTKEGDLGTISNEQSNKLCFQAPYKIVGSITLPDDEVMVFSGDGSNSEIGIGSLKTCSYRKLYNKSCLKFSDQYPITGVARKDFQRGIVVTFTDKFNPVRRFELKKLADTTECDDLLLFKKINQPCLTVKSSSAGNMPEGMYSVALAYVVDNQVYSDWYSVTNRITLNKDRRALQVDVEGLDTSFDEFSLVVIGNYIDPVTKGATKLAKIVGTYSTKVKRVTITDFINQIYETLPLSQLVIKKNTWSKAGIISGNANYLILADLVGREEENYQLKAMSIKTEYTVTQVALDYYEKEGEDVGYYRDENYDFYIQGVYNSGEVTDKFHIPGRVAESKDRSAVSSADVYEYDKDYDACEEINKIQRWQVENTAGKMNVLNNDFKCNRRLLGRGEMGFHESTDLYADNVAMFGEWANTPIRYHRMPDECKVSRYSVIDGKTYLNILGVRFKNIPKFDNPDIVGYKITRSDRKGGNGTVIARGLMTNLRSYMDPQLGKEVVYTNYPVNNLGPDNFLSSTQTAYRSGRETQFTPLTEYYKDRFTFFSPHTQFEPRYSMGIEMKIEAEEIAEVNGKFEVVHDHPRQKLLNQFAFWLSAAVGFIESALIILGKNGAVATKTTYNRNLVHTGSILTTNSVPLLDTDNTLAQEFNIRTVGDLINLDIVGYIRAQIAAGRFTGFGAVRTLITSILSLGIKIPYSIMGGIIEADKVFTTIYNFTPYTDYVYQYNSHAFFNQSKCVANGNKRRRIVEPASYIPSDVVSVDDKIYNNYFREKTVYMQLNKPLADPSTKDTTNNTMVGFGACDSKQARSVGSAFYVTNKAVNPNQYGALGSSNPVSMHSCVLPFSDSDITTTDVLYGGDCIITRYQFQKRMQFFNQNIANTNYPDGVEYDYRKYRNIAYPRFWMDSTKFDFSALLAGNTVNYSRFSRTTTAKYNLDCKNTKDGKNIARVDDAYMYTSNNTVMDFIVEADYNPNFREKTDLPFYSKESTNLSDIFRSDRLSTPEEFNINRVYSDLYTTEIFAQQQRDDFDPLDPIPVTQPNSVIYSLPSFNLQEVDNWQYFLPANFFSFRESDFGQLTAIHKIDQDRIIFLFSKSSPYISMGRDFLELEGTGRKITIGDGGLFAQDPREIMPTDNNYAACNSRYAFSNTHMGRYFPSEKQGRIIQFTEGLDDITQQGVSYWCKNYMPIKFYKYFPNYPEQENPVGGVGYLSVFDSFTETIYITKRDFSPKRELINDIAYVPETQTFTYRDRQISLRDSAYFNDISWTISYSPSDKAFCSWHDWHPDLVIQTDNHFMTIKNNGVWAHNDNYDSFCNFYGQDYPFEIEPVSSSGQQIETVRSIEYLLEVYNYKNSGRDRFHILNENFDALLVRNTEQISPLLYMTHGNPNPEENQMYPVRTSGNPVAYNIPFFKEENKYRVNMFWDTTKDRGEYSEAEYHLFATDESGYKGVINPTAINIDRPEEERKKFRHYWNKFRLIKTKSGNKQFVTKLLNVKKLISQR